MDKDMVHAPSRVLSPSAEITQAQVEELLALLEKATPGPWKTDVRVYSNGCFDAHWSIQTVDKQPEHPWSPRFVAWMTGTVRSDLRINDIPGAKFCRECDSWHLGWREVGVDVRADPKAEADAKLIAAMRNALPALLRLVPSAEELALREAAVAFHQASAKGAPLEGLSPAQTRLRQAARAYARSVEERDEV